MKRVLLPIDGTECALNAANLIIAKRSRYSNPDDLDIHLVNVQPKLSHDITRFASRSQIEGFHHDESEKAMRKACELFSAVGAKFTCHHLVGSAAETIAELAESLRCDQIVMGTHGRSAIAELLTGSITLKVVHLSKVPVLLVKTPKTRQIHFGGVRMVASV